jgi:arginyl-tRNA synthetase
MRRCDSQLDFDLELAKQNSSDNPVYYVQYAHARICSINRNAAEVGLVPPTLAQFDFSHLTLAEEIALIRQLSRFPEAVEGAALHYEPHRLVFYLQDLAAQLHSYYNRYRVLDEDAQVTSARLYLVNAVRIVLANALRLLGVSAPEQM